MGRLTDTAPASIISGPPCHVVALLDTADDDADRDIIRGCMYQRGAQSTWLHSSSAVVRMLADAGYVVPHTGAPLTSSVVARHCKDGCVRCIRAGYKTATQTPQQEA